MNAQTCNPELVMAWHDEQLSAAEAEQIGAHVEQCAACRAVVADIEQLSAQMREWTVEDSSPRLAGRVASMRPVSRVRPWMWKSATAFAVTVFAIFLVTWQSIPGLPGSNAKTSHMDLFLAAPAPPKAAAERKRFDANDANGGGGGGGGGGVAFRADKLPQQAHVEGLTDTMGAVALQGTMIARSASMTILAKDFPNARAAMERIVAASHGYVQKLETAKAENAARSLNATLGIPSGSLESTLTELRKLGVVEEEAQNGEEVTQQYTDLVARLTNARNTEKRLTAVLAERTGKVPDILQVEKEIARVRGEIEQMDAEQRGMTKRVQFATVTISIVEEFKKSVVTPSTPGTGTRLWNATMDGLANAREIAIETAEFLLRNLPTFVFCIAILFLPVRWGWRRWKTFEARNLAAQN